MRHAAVTHEALGHLMIHLFHHYSPIIAQLFFFFFYLGTLLSSPPAVQSSFFPAEVFTFAGASSNQARSLSQVVVDLHVSTKYDQSFDQLHVVHLEEIKGIAFVLPED